MDVMNSSFLQSGTLYVLLGYPSDVDEAAWNVHSNFDNLL